MKSNKKDKKKYIRMKCCTYSAQGDVKMGRGRSLHIAISTELEKFWKFSAIIHDFISFS